MPRAVTVSFLVPAWNAERHVSAFVDAFRSLTRCDAELVLCAGGGDATFALAKAREDDRVRVVEQVDGDGKQGALRKCLALSRGAVIYLTDIDCRPHDAVVANLVRPLLQGRAKVVTGTSRPLMRQLHRPMVRVHWAIEQAASPTQERFVAGILGRNAAVMRAVLEKLHAFDIPAPSGTDYTLAKEVLRHDQSILYVPGEPMPSEYPERFSAYVHKQARWLRNVCVLGTRYRAHREVLAVLPTLVMPFLLVGAVVAAVGLGLYLLPLLCLAIVARALINRQAYQRKAGFRPSLLGSAAVFLADQCAASKATWQMIRGQTTW